MPTLTERLNRWRFRRVVQAITATPPVAAGPGPFAALSMVHHRDVLPYLLAAKSFVHYARPSRVIVVADPTLDESDGRLLAAHLPGIEILPAKAFQRPALPIGGTWERLSAIAEINREISIVQVDADTVTSGVPNDVIDAATKARSFIIRSEPGVEIVPLDVAQGVGERLLQESHHIQAVAESKLTQLSDWARLRYARGCSGFTGFGRGALDPALLAAISLQMRGIHGDRWDEWGTEQVTSNLLAASAEGAFMLPHPKYCNADSKAASTVVAHYIGYARHVTRDYEHAARRVIGALKQG